MRRKVGLGLREDYRTRICGSAHMLREIKKRKGEGRSVGYKVWWDRGCTRKKRELHRIYKKWKRGKLDREEYLAKKKECKAFLKEKRKEWRKKEEELRNLRNPEEIWKQGGKKEWRDNHISNKEWEKHFIDLLDGRRFSKGTEAKELEGKEKSKVAESELLETGAKEVTLEEEIWQALKRMKDKKAAGIQIGRAHV